MFNVFYRWGDVPRKYLRDNVTEDVAKKYAKKLADTYVGKSYPNGMGDYPISNIEVRKV